MKWTGQFADIDGKIHKVTISNSNAGADVELIFDTDPVRIDYSINDINTGVVPIAASVAVVTSIDLSDMYTDLPNGTTILIENETDGKTEFKGYITPAQWDSPLYGVNDSFTLDCIDTLSVAKYYPYQPINGDPNSTTVSEADAARAAQRAITTTDAVLRRFCQQFGINKIISKVSNVTISEEAFLPEDWTKSKYDGGDWMTWQDVVAAIGMTLGCGIYVWGDTMYVLPFLVNCDNIKRSFTKIYYELYSATVQTYNGTSWATTTLQQYPMVYEFDTIDKSRSSSTLLSIAPTVSTIQYDISRSNIVNFMPEIGGKENFLPGFEPKPSAISHTVSDPSTDNISFITEIDGINSQHKYYQNRPTGNTFAYYWNGQRGDLGSLELDDYNIIATGRIKLRPIATKRNVGTRVFQFVVEYFITNQSAPDVWNISDDVPIIATVNGSSLGVHQELLTNPDDKGWQKRKVTMKLDNVGDVTIEIGATFIRSIEPVKQTQVGTKEPSVILPGREDYVMKQTISKPYLIGGDLTNGGVTDSAYYQAKSAMRILKSTISYVDMRPYMAAMYRKVFGMYTAMSWSLRHCEQDFTLHQMPIASAGGWSLKSITSCNTQGSIGDMYRNGGQSRISGVINGVIERINPTTGAIETQNFYNQTVRQLYDTYGIDYVQIGFVGTASVGGMSIPFDEHAYLITETRSTYGAIHVNGMPDGWIDSITYTVRAFAQAGSIHVDAVNVSTFKQWPDEPYLD